MVDLNNVFFYITNHLYIGFYLWLRKYQQFSYNFQNVHKKSTLVLNFIWQRSVTLCCFYYYYFHYDILLLL